MNRASDEAGGATAPSRTPDASRHFAVFHRFCMLDARYFARSRRRTSSTFKACRDKTIEALDTASIAIDPIAIDQST